ncbi:MAG: signal peptidase I [Cyanobium sp. NAT70]|nr:signal peptidase I [Cyanobium sp. NAT70]|tara:strand:- start:34 stop:657 length:624 start_codon:yes stop_codon:yes gene_type:complete
MSESSEPSSRFGDSNFWRSLVLWALLALLLRWLVIEPRWIPSGSMLPTLQLQDRILVEKIRPRLSRSRHRPLPLESVVVFAAPPQLVDAGYDPSAALIKRVVGLPGDQLEVDHGVLIRNHDIQTEPWLTDPIDYSMEPVEVPPGQLWVMGDNRNSSLDSHLWGALPEENVIGTAVWRYWPLNRFGPIRLSETAKTRLKPGTAVVSDS